MNDFIDDFQNAMRSAGLETSADILPDGKLNRFKVKGDRPDSKNGWYVLFGDDAPAGQYGCFKRGISEIWTSSKESTITDEQKTRQAEKIRQARQLRDAEEKQVRAECRQWCADNWRKAKDATKDHPYLKRKGVQAHGLKQLRDSLLIPLRDMTGTIQGIQFIARDGSKLFKTGTSKKGNYFAIGKPKDQTLLLSEGYATGASLHEATGHAVAVAFDAGNLLSVAKNLRNKFPKIKIVICADNDESGIGQEKAKEAALAVGGVVAIPHDVGDDFNDVHLKLGVNGIRTMMAAARKPAGVAAKMEQQFEFISAATLTCRPPNWLIKNFIEKHTIGSLFGEAASMKTFIVIDMGLCISTGKGWHGHRVKQGPVLYICGEGKAGIAKRIKAWEKVNDTKAPLFFVSTSAAQLLDANSLGEVELAANKVASEQGDPLLIIIDTLNRNFGPGDENSTSDMTTFIQAIDHLKDRLQCAIIIVHHSGLGDARRGRGSSALRGALDFEYNCDKSGDTIEEQVITLTNTKTKDHEAPAPKSFKPIIVDLGQVDEDMKPITSLVLELTGQRTIRKPKRLSGANRISLDALKAIAMESGKATEESWRKETYARGIAEANTPEAKKKAFSRARNYLLENNYISTRNDIYWIQGRGTDRDITGHCPDLSPLLNGPDGDIFQGGDKGDKGGHNGTCPDLSPLGRGTDRDISLKRCPVVPPGSAETPFFDMEDENAEFF